MECRLGLTIKPTLHPTRLTIYPISITYTLSAYFIPTDTPT